MADSRPGPATKATAKAAEPKATPPGPPEADAEPAPPQPSLGELVANASRDLSVLVRSEIELAKLELKVEAKKAAIGGAAFGAAAFLALFALLLLSFAAAYGINSLGLDEGWSFLIVGGTYLLLAGILVAGGAGSLKKIGPPRRTIKTTRETVGVLKDRGRAAAKDAARKQPAA